MKQLIAVFIGVFFLAGCGRSDNGTSALGGSQRVESMTTCSSSPVVGRWLGSILGHPDAMTFDENCNGTSSYCGTTFSYPNVTENSGMVEITVNFVSGKAGCLPKGKTTCAYVVRTSSLHFNCGGANLTYVKN